MEKSQKVKLGIVLAVALSLLIAAGVAVFVVNYSFGDNPTLSIIDESNNFYAFVEPNLSYNGYRFQFEGKNDSFFVNSQSNMINLNNLSVEYGEDYNISACYLGENEGGNSKFSPLVTWTAKKHLAAPKISKTNQGIKWDAVDGAVRYLVYCNGKPDTQTSCSFDFGNLPGGEYSVFVVAVSDKAYLLKSEQSNVVKYEHIHFFSAFESKPIFNVETKTLTAVHSEKLSKVVVLVGKETYSVDVMPREIVGGYRYTINISAIYQPEQLIGVMPANIDEHNLYQGLPTFVE